MSADGSGSMFDRIAGRYDRLNRIMSVGLDRGWRNKLVAALQLSEGRVLDLASGTADVAIAIASKHPDVHVTGVDPSQNMLSVGAEKATRAGLDDRIELVVGDAQALPFEADTFAASCISFGIRNVPDRLLGLEEMARVTRPGGVVAVLELTEPSEGLLAPLARMHVHHVVPRLGAWLSGDAEYRYLQRSIAAFPPPAEFAALMARAGLQIAAIESLGFGAAHLFVAHASRQ